MPYLDQAALAQNPDFRARMTVALAKVALDIVGEARPGEPSGYYAYYNRRHELGVGILNNPTLYIDRFCWAVATNSVINADSPDGDLEFTIITVYNDMAGVNSDEIPQ